MATSAVPLPAGADITAPGFELKNFAGNQLGLERGVYADGAIVVGNENDASDARVTIVLGHAQIVSLFVFLQSWYALGRPYKTQNGDTIPDPAWPLLSVLAGFVAHVAAGNQVDTNVARHIHSKLAQAAQECFNVFKYKTVDVQANVLTVTKVNPGNDRSVRLQLGAALNSAKDEITGGAKTVISNVIGEVATNAKSLYADDLVIPVLWWLRKQENATENHGFLLWALEQFIGFADAVSWVRHGYNFGSFETPLNAHRGLTLLQIVDKYFPESLTAETRVPLDTTRPTYAEEKAAKEAATEAAESPEKAEL